MKVQKLLSDVAVVIIMIAMYAGAVIATIIGARLVVNGANYGDPIVIALAVIALSAGVFGSAALLDLIERSDVPHRVRMWRRKRVAKSQQRPLVGNREWFDD